MPHIEVPIEDGPDNDPISVGSEGVDWDELDEVEREKTQALFDDPPIKPDSDE